MSQSTTETSSTPISSFDITSQSQQQTLNSQALRPINNNNSRRSSPFVLRLIVAIVLLLFATISVADFIAWSFIHPLPPVFQVSKISHPNSTPDKDCYVIMFLITNPNKNLSLFMDRFVLVIALQGKTKVSARESMTILPANNVSADIDKNSRKDFHVHGRMLKLNSFLQKEKEVNLSMHVTFRIRYLAWNWLPKRESMGVECRNLSMRLSSAKEKGEGNLMGESGHCSVQKHV